MSRRFGMWTALAGVLALAAGFTLGQDAQQRRGFSVKVTEPGNGEIAIGRTKIAAEVKIARADLVEAVEFYIGDSLAFRDTEPPYEFFHDFGETAEARAVRAVAVHREGVRVSDVIVTRKMTLSFAVRVNRVLINAVVTNRQGGFVHDLDPEDFIVYEDGEPQPVIDFTYESRPLSVALLLDTSGSMQERISKAHEGASGFIESLREEDRAMVVDFADRVYLLADLTSDMDAIQKTIRSTSAAGGTAIYDAVHAVLRKMRTVDGRKAVVLLSDGGDTTSQFTRKRVVEEAKAADVTIYSIGIRASGPDSVAKAVLKEFSESTGGRHFTVKKADELPAVFDAITDDLRSQYNLTYQSPNDVFDGRWIEIEVRPNDRQHTVRTRKGYYAVRSSS